MNFWSKIEYEIFDHTSNAINKDENLVLIQDRKANTLWANNAEYNIYGSAVACLGSWQDLDIHTLTAVGTGRTRRASAITGYRIAVRASTLSGAVLAPCPRRTV